MNITDEMVERAAEGLRGLVREHRREEVARAVLTAALGDVEPLEDVLTPEWTRLTIFPGMTAFIEFSTMDRTFGTGPTIADAIRNAVANAQGEAK